MKRTFVVGLFGGLLGSVVLFILLSTAGIVGARGTEVRSDISRPGAVSAATPLTSTFTYQGQLKNSGSPITDACNFQFGLWDSATGGAQIGITQTLSAPVSAGYFTALINTGNQFGNSAFNGDKRWLAIAVDCPNVGGGYTAFNQRQQLTAAPYALALPGLYTQPNATSPNIIGGYNGNFISSTVVGGVIGGGGASGLLNRVQASYATVGGGEGNTASKGYASVSGGKNNTASGIFATVGGGSSITVTGQFATASGGEGNSASSDLATIGGGNGNTASGYASFVGGGQTNTAGNDNATVGGGYNNMASGPEATIGGGDGNIANGYGAFVGGGGYDGTNTSSNLASGNAATIGGGLGNTASGNFSTVGGGDSNTASFYYATVGGGYHNSASGAYSFAAGQHAKANASGTFVWNDAYTTTDFTANVANSFIVRASGGIYLGHASASTPSGKFIDTWTGAYLSDSGVWTDVSDRNAKENFSAVNSRDVLAKLIAMPVSIWNYKVDDASIRHIGPTAQDFYSTFGVGRDDTHIAALDTNGVALVAIQGLYQENQDLKSQNADLTARVSKLEQNTPATNPPAQSEPFNVSTLLSVLAMIAIGWMWLQQRRSKRGQA